MVEAALGAGAKFNAMNVIRNGQGQAISRWHVDDVLEFPLPPDIPRFDARIRMPVLWMTVQVALSDIDEVEHGPTQFVPGSHYSGRVKPPANPSKARAASGLLQSRRHLFDQSPTWHRGAPNLSERVRYIMQLQYATGWADRRFKGVA